MQRAALATAPVGKGKKLDRGTERKMGLGGGPRALSMGRSKAGAGSRVQHHGQLPECFPFFLGSPLPDAKIF